MIPLDTVLKTARCTLRAPSEEDIPHIFSATRFAGFNDGMLWEQPEKAEELYEPLKRNTAAWVAGTAYTFMVEMPEPPTFVGRVSIRKTEKNGVWDVGFWTHPEQQGRGYTIEAVEAVLEFGFRQLGAAYIEACLATWNLGSRQVFEKIGMTFSHHVSRGFQKNGRWVAEDCLSLSRASWKALETTRFEL